MFSKRFLKRRVPKGDSISHITCLQWDNLSCVRIMIRELWYLVSELQYVYASWYKSLQRPLLYPETSPSCSSAEFPAKMDLSFSQKAWLLYSTLVQLPSESLYYSPASLSANLQQILVQLFSESMCNFWHSQLSPVLSVYHASLIYIHAYLWHSIFAFICILLLVASCYIVGWVAPSIIEYPPKQKIPLFGHVPPQRYFPHGRWLFH